MHKLGSKAALSSVISISSEKRSIKLKTLEREVPPLKTIGIDNGDNLFKIQVTQTSCSRNTSVKSDIIEASSNILYC
jgi:hypothetical protein